MELNRRRAPRTGCIQRARRRQAGFTLTEVLISIGLLTLVGASLTGAFGIGYRVLGAGGAQASLRGNNDVMALEQQVGADITRASCLASGSTLIPTGGCATFNGALSGTPAARCPAQYVFCVGWFKPGDTTCHEVVYSQRSSGTDLWIERRDLATGAATRMSTGGLNLSVNLNPTQTSNNVYSWTKSVDVTVNQTWPAGTAKPRNPVTNLVFHVVPLSSDPLSPASSGAPAC